MASVFLRLVVRQLPRLATVNATQRVAPMVAMAVNQLNVLNSQVFRLIKSKTKILTIGCFALEFSVFVSICRKLLTVFKRWRSGMRVIGPPSNRIIPKPSFKIESCWFYRYNDIIFSSHLGHFGYLGHFGHFGNFSHFGHFDHFGHFHSKIP